ncbi:MAG: hypothetical protein AB7U85_08255 [Alphaproteobacteria bacterium]
MKKLFIALSIFFISMLEGCSSAPQVDIIENKTVNYNAEFNAGRVEGLQAPNAFPDFGTKSKDISAAEEEILIINKWQSLEEKPNSKN